MMNPIDPAAGPAPEAGPSRTPTVSVVMPTYNPGRYVAEAIGSILGQTFADFELLISDAGSTDGSLEVMRRIAGADARVRLLVRPKTGIVGALNELLGLARGELIARMDADDVAMPARLGRQVAYLDEHPECVVVGSRVTIIDPDGQPLTVLTDMLTHEQIDRGLLAGIGASLYHPSVMYRKSVVLGIGAYRDIYDEAEDLDLFLRLAEVGRVANIEEPLLKYREHLAKSSRVKVVRLTENGRRILEDAHRRRGLEYRPPADAAEVRPFLKSDVFRTWGWWALMSGNVAIARKYAAACLARTPFDPGSWRLFLCAIRGR
jgi:glycosyltransferase involved in cell wall biosynthesis